MSVRRCSILDLVKKKHCSFVLGFFEIEKNPKEEKRRRL